jgi:hypothetical protein
LGYDHRDHLAADGSHEVPALVFTVLVEHVAAYDLHPIKLWVFIFHCGHFLKVLFWRYRVLPVASVASVAVLAAVTALSSVTVAALRAVLMRLRHFNY